MKNTPNAMSLWFFVLAFVLFLSTCEDNIKGTELPLLDEVMREMKLHTLLTCYQHICMLKTFLALQAPRKVLGTLTHLAAHQ